MPSCRRKVAEPVKYGNSHGDGREKWRHELLSRHRYMECRLRVSADSEESSEYTCPSPVVITAPHQQPSFRLRVHHPPRDIPRWFVDCIIEFAKQSTFVFSFRPAGHSSRYRLYAAPRQQVFAAGQPSEKSRHPPTPKVRRPCHREREPVCFIRQSRW